jgi:S1-C subfamily serine protease
MTMRIITALLLSLSAILMPLEAMAQVTSNVFERVLNVRVNAGTPHEGTATAFTVDVDGREYLITAKHVVQGLKDKDKIDVFMDGDWSPLDVDIFRCEGSVDIAVLIPPHQLTVNFDLPFENKSFYVGQDAYFLGFPYGLQAPAHGLNGPYPLAIVKRGTISGLIPLAEGSKGTMLLLDGYNNPGFSGGPIVYRDLNQSGVVLNVIGVVSGFEPEVVPAMKEHDIKSPADAGQEAKAQPWRIKKRSNGTYFEYVDNGAYVALNTGIVIGYEINPAIDLIRQHPVGPEVKDLPGNRPK